MTYCKERLFITLNSVFIEIIYLLKPSFALDVSPLINFRIWHNFSCLGNYKNIFNIDSASLFSCEFL